MFERSLNKSSPIYKRLLPNLKNEALQRVLCARANWQCWRSETAQRTPVSGRGCALRSPKPKPVSLCNFSCNSEVPALRLMARFFSCLLKTPDSSPTGQMITQMHSGQPSCSGHRCQREWVCTCGMPVKLKFDAYPFQTMGTGHLRWLSPDSKIVETAQVGRNFELEIALDQTYIKTNV